MNEHTKGKLKAKAFPGTENDPTWIICAEDGKILFQTISENDEANAKELARRWNKEEE